VTITSDEGDDDDDDPLASVIRNILDSGIFSSLANISKLQASIDAFLPRFEDFPSPLTQIIASMPKPTELGGMAGLMASLPTPEELSPLASIIASMPKPTELMDVSSGLTSLQEILMSSVPMTDFSELSGFHRIAQGLAPNVNLTMLDSFSRVAEQSLPAFLFADRPEPTIDEVLEWAVSMDFEEEREDKSTESTESTESTDPLERLRQHLGLLATWIFDEATRFQAGVIRFNQMVDQTNAQLGRYQQLGANLIFLYGIIALLQHMI
jgi:hypothetical protein